MKVFQKIKRCMHFIYILWFNFWDNVLAASVVCPNTLRILLYRIAGNDISYKVIFSPRCFLGWGKGKLFIGEGSYVNYNCFFELSDNIIIGRACNIAMNVHFVNGTHEIGGAERRAGKGVAKPIVIGDGCWIGADTIIKCSPCQGHF